MKTEHLHNVKWQLKLDHLSSDVGVCWCCYCLFSDFPGIILYSLSSLSSMATEVFVRLTY